MHTNMYSRLLPPTQTYECTHMLTIKRMHTTNGRRKSLFSLFNQNEFKCFKIFGSVVVITKFIFIKIITMIILHINFNKLL